MWPSGHSRHFGRVLGESGDLQRRNIAHRTGIVAKSQEEKSRTNWLSGLLQFGAMPLSVSSLIAFSFFDRCASPMPRNTFGALVNWMLS